VLSRRAAQRTATGGRPECQQWWELNGRVLRCSYTAMPIAARDTIGGAIVEVRMVHRDRLRVQRNLLLILEPERQPEEQPRQLTNARADSYGHPFPASSCWQLSCLFVNLMTLRSNTIDIILLFCHFDRLDLGSDAFDDHRVFCRHTTGVDTS
jgi:hypothetical protein